MTACAIFGNGTLLSWTKMQPTVAKSSMEAEYMALCFGTCEILGLNITVTKLGYAKQKPISVYFFLGQSISDLLLEEQHGQCKD